MNLAAPSSTRQPRWFFAAAVSLLLLAAFFRLWQLGSVPPGMRAEELVNAQLSDEMRRGNVSVIYEEAHPAREGLYFALLATSTAITGRGLILWRLPSVWIAMLSLALTVSLIRRWFNVRVALLVLGLMAVSFWPVWIGRVVMHVTLMPLVTTAALYALTRAYLSRQGADSGLWFTVGGIALGIAQYVHVTAWTLPALLVAFAGYRALVSQADRRRHWGNLIYALGLLAALSLPLLIFLLNNPGAREPVPISQQPGLIAEMPERLASSVAALALRGDMSPNHNVPGRPVMNPLMGGLLVMGIGVALARWRQPSYGLTLLWLVVGLLPTLFLPRKPDFEFMVMILPVIFVFPALALYSGFRAARRIPARRWRRLAMAGVSTGVAALVASSLAQTYRDYFIIWPKLGDVRLNYEADLGVLAHYLDTSRDPTPIAICSTPVDRSQNRFALTNAELLGYLMHRRQVPIRYFDCTQSLVLADGGRSQRIIFPRGHYYDYLPGPLLAWMRTARDEQVPGVRPDVILRLDVSRELADTAGAFITTAPTAWPPESGDVRLAALPVPFTANVTFLGYSVRDDTLRATDWVELTTYWRLDGPPPPDITQFSHLLGNPVVVVAQDDGIGIEIATLHPRDVFLQYSMIQTPGGMDAGLYPLSVGLYDPLTGQRLQAYENSAPRADRLFLQQIQITD